MLKELCCTAMLLTAGANLYAQEPQSIEKSQTIVADFPAATAQKAHTIIRAAAQSRFIVISFYRASGFR